MRHLIVTRTVAGLALLLVAACLLFARVVTPRVAPPAVGPAGEGGALFARRCAACHAADELSANPGVGERSDRELREFLAGHGHSSPDEDPAIAAFLRAGAGRR